MPEASCTLFNSTLATSIAISSDPHSTVCSHSAVPLESSVRLASAIRLGGSLSPPAGRGSSHAKRIPREQSRGTRPRPDFAAEHLFEAGAAVDHRRLAAAAGLEFLAQRGCRLGVHGAGFHVTIEHDSVLLACRAG